MGRIHVHGLLLVVSLLSVPTVAPAQEASETRTFGPTSTVSHTIQAYAFAGQDPMHASNVTSAGAGGRSCTNPPCFLLAPVFLPAGAIVINIELEACDTTPSGQVFAQLLRVGPLGNSPDDLGTTLVTGTAATPGCAKFTQAATSHTIDNVNNTYLAVISLGGADANIRFYALRIFYRLQVSPAPATATFNDVPTNHPFFRVIEALAASGITVGCSTTPPLFCPGAVVTREQMAAFIARALGLHWAP